MTQAEQNRQRVQRLLDSVELLNELRIDVAKDDSKLQAVLAEVMDDAQRERLRLALTH